MTDLEWLQKLYRERGFVVFACKYPKDIGEVLDVEEDFLKEHWRWKVTSKTNRQDLMPQLRDSESPSLRRPYFYRAEAMD